MELADIDEAANMQEKLADAYRRAIGLLSGEQIRRLRQGKKLSQQALADALDVGIASIKRWETGVVQSKSMDILLRSFLLDHSAMTTPATANCLSRVFARFSTPLPSGCGGHY